MDSSNFTDGFTEWEESSSSGNPSQEVDISSVSSAPTKKDKVVTKIPSDLSSDEEIVIVKKKKKRIITPDQVVIPKTEEKKEVVTEITPEKITKPKAEPLVENKNIVENPTLDQMVVKQEITPTKETTGAVAPSARKPTVTPPSNTAPSVVAPPAPKKKVQKPVPSATLKVIGYVRVSTEMQEESGFSLQEQQNQITNFCRYKMFNCIEVRQEVCSGAVKSKDRPILAEVLQLLYENKCDGLVVTKLDRLGRGAGDTITLIDELSKKGKKFFSIVDGVDSTTETGIVMLRMLSVFAEMELNMIRNRVRLVMQGKKARGEVIGRIPFGKTQYLENGVNKVRDNLEELQTALLIKQLRATTVKRTNRKGNVRYIKMPFQEICLELNKRCIKPRTGYPEWFATQVQRIAKGAIEPTSNEGFAIFKGYENFLQADKTKGNRSLGTPASDVEEEEEESE